MNKIETTKNVEKEENIVNTKFIEYSREFMHLSKEELCKRCNISLKSYESILSGDYANYSMQDFLSVSNYFKLNFARFLIIKNY